MNSGTKWLGWLTLMLPLHMSEQLLFGIDEITRLKRVLASYYRWFETADYGTVVLVAVIGTLISAIIYLIDRGGQGRRVAYGALSLIGIGEIHHLVETATAMRYTPGTATAIPYVFFGVLLLRSAIRGPAGRRE